MKLAFKYRFYPTKEQADVLNRTLGCVRYVYKKRLYEVSGVKEYWIVDPKAREIEVYALVDDRYALFGRQEKQGALTSKLLQGFCVDLADIF